jgi:hypothetical protein
MNEEPQKAEGSPTHEVIQRAPMVFEEHLENIRAPSRSPIDWSVRPMFVEGPLFSTKAKRR